jgi:hypothetical protein
MDQGIGRGDFSPFQHPECWLRDGPEGERGGFRGLKRTILAPEALKLII